MKEMYKSMNCIKSCALGFVITLVSYSTVQGQDLTNAVTTGTPFLTIAPDSRGSALGDAGAAISPDVNSQFWNPAKYPFIKDDFGFSFSYTPWLAELVNDIGLFYLAGHKKFGDLQTVSASIKYFSLGDIQSTDENGEPLGTISPNEFAIDAAYSRKFSETFSGAVAFRYIYSDLTGGTRDDYYKAGQSYATDIAIYHTKDLAKSSIPINYAVGLNISNIGAKISYTDGEQSEFLPTNFRLGTAWSFKIDDYNEIRASLDMNKLLVPTPDKVNDPEGIDRQNTSPIKAVFSSWNDAPGGMKEEFREIMWSLGAEYVYAERFFVRGGYFYENEFKGNRKFFSAGAGFQMNVFALDVSYLIPTTPNSPLANTLRFSLSFGVDGIRNLLDKE